MKNIYVIDEHQTSKRNGVGTFIKEFIYCLQQLNVNICLISFNADVKEFNIEEKGDGIKYIDFPPFPGVFPTFSIIIEKFFRLYIEDSSENIFFFNHFPCDDFLKTVKKSHPLSKLLFVIHDQGWTTMLKGDDKKLEEIIQEQEDNTIRKEHKYIIDRFEVDLKTYNAADGVISLSEDTFSIMRNIYKKTDNLYMIANGCRDRCDYPVSKQQKLNIREKLNIDKEEKVLIYTGRLSKAKGTEVLIKSFNKIAKEIPKIRLIVTGSSNNKEYYHHLFNLSREVASKISFPGHILHEELDNWYKMADIGIFPSYVEQCSYSGIEMMMYGLPIIASDGFGVKCMFIDGMNAKIVKTGQSEDEFESNLTDGIRELLQSESMCNILGKKARKTFEIKYNIDKMLNEYNNSFIR
ncbi:MAG: glycosyltransferase [Prevotella sp.]|jgi:glycosyltransferase|nr:glycosyltransferase [Prevotella sp.]